MPESQHWTERRQRLVKCKVHGLHYDPQLTSTCPKCRKQGLGAAPRKKPQFLVLLLAILGVALVSYRLFGPGGAIFDIPLQAEPGNPDDTSVTLQPAGVESQLYRPQIEALETALFASEATDLEALAEQIVSSLDALVRELGTSPRAMERAVGPELEPLRAVLSREVTLEAVQDVQTDWLQLRRRRFQPAVWFSHWSAESATTDYAVLAAYRDIVDELERLLDAGASTAQRLAEPIPLNAPDIAGQRARRARDWQSFQAEWQARFEEVSGRIPLRPSVDAHPEMLLAIQHLEQALARVSSLAAEDLPERLRQGSSAPIDEARQSVDEARLAFELL